MVIREISNVKHNEQKVEGNIEGCKYVATCDVN